MNKTIKVLLVIAVIYLGIGGAYHYKSVSCYNIKHSKDKDEADHFEGPQGPKGLLSNIVFWPIIYYVDSNSGEGVFNCVPEEE